MRISHYLPFLLAFACGAPIDGDELGQVEQAFAGRVTPGYQLGTTTSHARLQCGRTNGAQVCTIPQTTSPTFFLDPGVDEPALVRGLFTALDNQLSVWTFTEVAHIDDAEIIVSDGVPCSGSSASNNIEAFGCVAFTAVGNNLTEGAGVVGSYTNHSVGVVRIDTADINAKFASSTSRRRLYLHAAGHGVTSWMGLGSRPDAPARSITSRTVDVSGPIIQTLSVGEACRANDFNVFVTPGAYIHPAGAQAICSNVE